MKKSIIFIAGGGNEIQSRDIDSLFAKYIDGKKLMYIPVALNRDVLGFEACYDWLTGVLLKFNYEIDVPQIHMYLDPVAINENIFTYDAIYIGGGNTFKLLDFIYKNNLFEKIKKFSKEGGVIYGGSAGAIILGNNINTVKEENDNKYLFEEGLNLFGNYSIRCHYNPDTDITKIALFIKRSNLPVIALPESTGVIIEDGRAKVVGDEPLYLFKDDNTSFLIYPGEYIN